jgi:HTH-type transcriptional regulator/antitoxin HipB
MQDCQRSTTWRSAIRDRRRALSLDQAALAERVGVSRQWIIEAEKGKPRAAIGLVPRTLEVLGIELWTELAPPPSSPGSLPGAAVDLQSILDAHRKLGGPLS